MFSCSFPKPRSTEGGYRVKYSIWCFDDLSLVGHRVDPTQTSVSVLVLLLSARLCFKISVTLDLYIFCFDAMMS